jgi:hypothetical protein
MSRKIIWVDVDGNKIDISSPLKKCTVKSQWKKLSKKPLLDFCFTEGCPSNLKNTRNIAFYENPLIEYGLFCANCYPNRDKLIDQIKKYEEEHWVVKAERALEAKEWYLEDGHGVCLFKETRRCNDDDCDTIYMLKGSEAEIAICIDCWDQNGKDKYETKMAIKDRFS